MTWVLTIWLAGTVFNLIWHQRIMIRFQQLTNERLMRLEKNLNRLEV